MQAALVQVSLPTRTNQLHPGDLNSGLLRVDLQTTTKTIEQMQCHSRVSSKVKDGSGPRNHLLIIVAKGWLSGSFQEGTLIQNNSES